jgi:hypothetical protein
MMMVMMKQHFEQLQYLSQIFKSKITRVKNLLGSVGGREGFCLA